MIFNALIIVVLIPLALRGVKYRPVGAATLLRDNLLIYGLGGLIVPFHRHQADRPGCCSIPTWRNRLAETRFTT